MTTARARWAVVGVVALVVVAGGLGACRGSASVVGDARPAPVVAVVEPPTLADAKPREYPGLHNVVAFHDGVYSGAVPEGDAGFASLAALGVRTVVSVDGAVPEVEAARARGIRYVHLPIGYNGFDARRGLELARAVRDAAGDGPVYVHCHHGKHRSAAAAGSAAAALGWMTPEEAVARMKVSGTSPNYTGLYRCVAQTGPADAGALEGVGGEFPEVSRPTGMVAAMVEIDGAFAHLELIEKAGWRTPADHPDLVPAAEAGRMADLLRVLAAEDPQAVKDAGFRRDLLASADAAGTLETMLAGGKAEPAALSTQIRAVGASCRSCHAAHRD